jgi:ABC-type glutathione transport system ATPase component
VQLIGNNDSYGQTPAATRPTTPNPESNRVKPGPVRALLEEQSNGTKKANGSLAASGVSTPAGNKNIFLNLNSPVAESGQNLSQGQRQLLCLARAMLKNPKVLMMDEATASIDYSTDAKIQETIRELKSTIITIAHRLQTIVDYDKVLVLEAGKVVEFGHPHELLLKGEDGVFYSMCESSGELENLLKMAKVAWDNGRLVDVSEESNNGEGSGSSS